MGGATIFRSKLVPAVAAAALCGVTGSSATAQQTVPAPLSVGTLSLPRPDFRFKGEVGRTYQDSDPATLPQIVRPPEGRPISC
jgi:hypothetical protein